MYPTRRMIFLVLFGAPLSLVAAIVSQPLWMIGVVWIVFAAALYLLDIALAARPSALTLNLRLPASLGVARAQDGFVNLAFAGSGPSEVELALDSGVRVGVSPEQQVCAIHDGHAEARFALTPLRRGEGEVGPVWARWRGPLGLCWRQRLDEKGGTVPIVPNIATVKEEAVRLFRREQGSYGLRAQLRSGEGAEFNALKEFAAGMDRRTVDWKQTARHGKLLAREFQAEENLHIVFALDTGRLMCEPLEGVPRIDRAIQAMLLLAFVALRLGDRVGVFAFDEKPVLSSGAAAGPNAFAVLQRLVARIDYSTAETNFTLGLTQLSGELAHRSIVVVFTDFSDTTSAELMLENVKRLITRHAVVFIAFRDEELESMARAEPVEPSDVSRAVLADAMLRDRGAVTARLKRLGVDVIDVPVDKIGAGLIEAYLSVKHGAG